MVNVSSYFLDYIFFILTKNGAYIVKRKFQSFIFSEMIINDRRGLVSGLCFAWRKGLDVSIIKCCAFFIHVQVDSTKQLS